MQSEYTSCSLFTISLTFNYHVKKDFGHYYESLLHGICPHACNVSINYDHSILFSTDYENKRSLKNVSDRLKPHHKIFHWKGLCLKWGDNKASLFWLHDNMQDLHFPFHTGHTSCVSSAARLLIFLVPIKPDQSSHTAETHVGHVRSDATLQLRRLVGFFGKMRMVLCKSIWRNNLLTVIMTSHQQRSL